MNILVLCTGNSARSILLESYLNAAGDGRVSGFSAGSHPTGTVNPGALRLLMRKGLPVSQLRSKSWDEFAAPDAPLMDLVITVCDAAAGETCPIWPGAPLRGHWGVDDPAAVTGSEAEIDAAFERAWDVLTRRADALLALPFADLDPGALKTELDRIGALP
ncbi:MAG: arsenate reductase ArsC [Rhodobacteraceae bacterium]|jgi:arsenate reductase|nr:arsenate reductase ArsC [Paracoccaceae bacterium]MBL4556967.1 arsenate reductase ArsC [Paracoccaceae bacterium]HBG99799.1 low molecular weight phosphatase family protein [Paracoccaceae bacterium]